MISCVHHFEILTQKSSKLLDYFIKSLNFKLVASKQTLNETQYVVKSKHSSFIVTSLNSPTQNKSKSSFYFETLGHLDCELFDKIAIKKDTVFNVALQVKDINRILENCDKNDVKIIKDEEKIVDGLNGHINHAIINSCIDGVVHTLVEKSSFKGKFLPLFEDNHQYMEQETFAHATTHFDHLTYATYKNKSNEIIDWYKAIFNMKKFNINRDEKHDFIVRTGNSGMKLKAINYWFCAETGLVFDNSNKDKTNDFKFVIAEPLDSNAENQISIFLNENKGPGIQHIGLHTPDILKCIENTKITNKGESFYVPPDSYYDELEKSKEIAASGQNLKDLKRNHVLIDIEETQGEKQPPKYLLQVFTRPLFEKDTFFLELIQRANGAFGFGAGNIKALWNAVHLTLTKKILK